MKRSEIIKEIAEHFTANKALNSSDLKSAEFLLNKLEKLGMEPPFSRFFEEQNIEDRWGVVDFGRTEFVRVIRNKWEPEDEKE